MRNNKMKGFTLVELLVVIAILAILATVSVVGYTSFIKSTEISSDQSLANQLNHFLEAYKVDHTNNFTNVTPDNVWEITDQIRDLGGLEEITPAALKYGHLYFRFDKVGDDYVGGEYVFVEDKDIKNYGMHIVMRAFGLVPNERPGFFEGNDGNLYFLIDTTGSNLAEAVRGFHTFDFLAEEDDAWAKFQEIVADAAAEGHTNISTALENTVFATAEGSKWIPGKESYDLVFHVDENVTLSEGTPTINIEVNNGVATPIVVPENVIQLEVGSLVLNADVSTLTNAPVVFEAPAKELDDVIDAEFPYTFVDGNGAECVVDDAHIVTPSGEEIKVKILNYLKDFDIKVVGAENKVYNSVAEDVFNDDKTAIIENKLNSAYIVWDGVTFSLALDETDYELYFSNPERSSLSSKKINWEVVSLNAPEGVTLTDADKACVVFDEETATFTLKKDDTTGLYPSITSITVKGTVAHVADGATAKSNTFTINLPRIDTATFTFGGSDVTSNSVAVYWGEKGDGSHFDSYDVALKTHASETTITGLIYDPSMTVSCDWGDSAVDGNNVKLNNVFDELDNEEKNKAVKITVNVGGYKKFEFTANICHAKFLFEQVSSGFKYVGTEGANLKATDLFKQVNPDATYDNVNVHAYIVPGGDIDETIKDLDENCALYTNATDGADDGVWVSNQTATWNGDFKFYLTGENATEIILVVTVDGVRASENIRLQVINAHNIAKDDYSSLKTLSNAGNDVVLLGDVTMNEVNGYFSIQAGKTFYGNCFTLDVSENGYMGGDENIGAMYGIIALAGNLQDTKVIGKVYGTFAGSANDKFGTNLVGAVDGATITNCYLSNTRAPLNIAGGGTVIVEDTVLFGGRYANVDLRKGELVIRGDVTTVQQTVEGLDKNNTKVDVIGIGIAAWFDDTAKKVTVESGANLKQYNFLDSSVANSLPVLNHSGAELVHLNQVFGSLFTADYEGYHFKQENNATPYVNSGIVAIDKYMMNYTVTTKAGQEGCSSAYLCEVFYASADPNKTYYITCDTAKYCYYPNESSSTPASDFTGVLAVTGQQLKDGVLFGTVGEVSSVMVDGLTYGFLLTNEDAKTLTLSGVNAYDNPEFDYDLGEEFEAVSSFTSAFHGAGIHYSHLFIDVHTPDRDNSVYKTDLKNYLALVEDGFYTPDKFKFDANGDITNYK